MAKYINDERLTDKVIEGMMNRCGLELVTSRIDDFTGNEVAVEPIIRMDDMIMVSCQNKSILDFARKFAEKVPTASYLTMFNTSAYSLGDEIVILEDFFASRFKITPELDELDEKLFKEYYKTMSLVFGKEFEQDAKVCYNKYTEENSKESEETAKSKE